MANTDKMRTKIRSKLDAIKQVADEPNLLVGDVFDLVKNDLPSLDGVVRRNIDDFKNRAKSKKTAQKDIFGELMKTFEGFLGSDTSGNDSKQSPKLKNKLKKFAQDAAKDTLHASKQITMDTVKAHLFSGDGICGSKITMPADNVEISPKEFDLLNMLHISPDSNSGQIVYEDSDNNNGYVQMNRELFNSFDSGTDFFFNNKDYKTILSMRWNDSSQKYLVSGLQGVSGATTTEQFLTDYYSNIDYPNLEHIVKNAMLMTIHGDGSEPKQFNVGMNFLDRILQKIFAICGQPKRNKNPLSKTAQSEVDENDANDDEFYFDFDNVEGIDIDDENNRLRRVLKFTDCNNFESPVNKSHLEDFIYFTGPKKKNIDDVVENTLNKVASAAYENSGGSIPAMNFQASITNLFILALPKALVSSILSPKIFLPIVILFKLIKGVALTVQQIMAKLAKLFLALIKKIFWKFIKAFWGYVKKALLDFIKKIAIKILLNKLKRWKAIIMSLISFLLALLEMGLDNCEAIFNAILMAIQGALNARVKLPIPGLLLAFADFLPGFSVDKAFMNVVERNTASGIPMTDLYGRSNTFKKSLHNQISGMWETMDSDSFIKIALKPSVIPAGPGGAVITPFVTGTGKLF